MDAIASAASTSAAQPTTGTTAPASTPAADATSTAKKSFEALFDDAKRDLKAGERLSKVSGHAYARIKGGERDQMCLNLSGNARNGQAFDLITRNGHQFHVYGGSGKDRVIVEVGRKAAAPAPTTTAPASAGTTTAGTQTAPAATDQSSSGSSTSKPSKSSSPSG